MMKTILSDNPDSLDKQVNEFIANKIVYGIIPDSIIKGFSNQVSVIHKASIFYGLGEGETSNTISTPIQKARSPSPKQKYCPKCKEIIPKTWKNHRKPEGCGWEE